MHMPKSPAIGLVLLCACATGGAQGPATASAVAASSAEPARPMKQIIEDDAVRIEETRLRGQTQRITVQSKLRGVQGYEIILPPAGKDPSQDRGAAGQRIWHLFDF
jgi:hypothetical protein